MISLLVTLLIAVLLLAVLWYVTGALGLPDPTRQIVMLIALLLVVIFLFRGYAI